MVASVSIGEASKIGVVAQNKTHRTEFGALALSIRGSVSALNLSCTLEPPGEMVQFSMPKPQLRPIKLEIWVGSRRQWAFQFLW